MRDIEQKRLERLRQLEAAYSVAGHDALKAMRPAELRMLGAEKQLDLLLAERRLQDYPHDEVGALRKLKLEHEMTDIRGFMEAKHKDGPELDMG